jgi:hypothetical protein
VRKFRSMSKMYMISTQTVNPNHTGSIPAVQMPPTHVR